MGGAAAALMVAAALGAPGAPPDRAVERVLVDCADNARLRQPYDAKVLARAIRKMPRDIRDFTDCRARLRLVLRQTRLVRGRLRVREGALFVPVACRRERKVQEGTVRVRFALRGRWPRLRGEGSCAPGRLRGRATLQVDLDTQRAIARRRSVPVVVKLGVSVIHFTRARVRAG